MAESISNDTLAFSVRAKELYENAMACDFHEALRCIGGIGEVAHPFFSDLAQKDRDNLLIGLVPLVNLIRKDLEQVFEKLEILAVDMEKAEMNHEKHR